MRDLLTQPIRCLGIAPRAERALMQPLDRLGVVQALGENGERNIVHRVAAYHLDRARSR